MSSPFRINADHRPAPPRAVGGAMRVELVLVLALTTPILILGVAARQTFGVVLTVALFSWIFAFTALVRSFGRSR